MSILRNRIFYLGIVIGFISGVLAFEGVLKANDLSIIGNKIIERQFVLAEELRKENQELINQLSQLRSKYEILIKETAEAENR